MYGTPLMVFLLVICWFLSATTEHQKKYAKRFSAIYSNLEYGGWYKL